MLVVKDGLDALYLGSFLFGLLFAALSLLLGGSHLAHHHGPLGHLPASAKHHGIGPEGAPGWLNSGTVLAFIAWFGGVGYLVRNGLDAYAWVSVLTGLLGGLGGAAIIGWFLLKVILPADQGMDPADFQLPGTLARVTSAIRAGGTGEIVYEQGGVRQVSAARSHNGRPLPRGTEVVVLGCERGVASVQAWTSLVGEENEDSSGESRHGASPGNQRLTGSDLSVTGRVSTPF